MTSNTIRAFALGLIVSSAILGLVFNLSSKEEALTEKEMVELLEKNDYIVTKITEETTKEEVTNGEETQAQENTTQPSESTTQNSTVETPAQQTTEQPTTEQQTPVTTVTITVQAGMNSRDVGNMLEAKGVVGSDEFYQAVLDSGKETKLKQGTFDIPSNATAAQVIGIIFK